MKVHLLAIFFTVNVLSVNFLRRQFSSAVNSPKQSIFSRSIGRGEFSLGQFSWNHRHTQLLYYAKVAPFWHRFCTKLVHELHHFDVIVIFGATHIITFNDIGCNIRRLICNIKNVE